MNKPTCLLLIQVLIHTQAPTPTPLPSIKPAGSRTYKRFSGVNCLKKWAIGRKKTRVSISTCRPKSGCGDPANHSYHHFGPTHIPLCNRAGGRVGFKIWMTADDP